jgi:hypothetical protein
MWERKEHVTEPEPVMEMQMVQWYTAAFGTDA